MKIQFKAFEDKMGTFCCAFVDGARCATLIYSDPAKFPIVIMDTSELPRAYLCRATEVRRNIDWMLSNGHQEWEFKE